MKLLTVLQTAIILCFLPVILSGSALERFGSDAITDGVISINDAQKQEKIIDERLEEIDGLIEQGDLQKALELLDEVESSAKSIGYYEGLAGSVAYRGDIYITQGRYEQAIEILSDAYAVYEKNEQGTKIGNLLASAYRFNNDLEQSLKLYNKLIDETDGEEDPVFKAGLEQNVAVVYEMLGDTQSAIDRYFNSLEIAESKSDTTLKIIVNNNIGELYRKEGNIELAERYIMRSLELSKDKNALDDMSRAYNNLGLVYRMKNDFDKALDYYHESLEIAYTLGSVVRPVQILFNIGYIHLDRKQLDLAREAFQESLEKSLELNITRGIYHNNFGLGDVDSEYNEHESAIQHYSLALEIAEQIGSPDMKTAALERLWSAHEKIGQYKSAFSYLNQHKLISDSLKAFDKDQALERYETLFELRNERSQNAFLEEKLQAQRYTIVIGVISITLLFIASMLLLWMYQKQRLVSDKLRVQHAETEYLYRQVEIQKKELSKLNETKDKLFSILGHDLRSPISNLQSLVFLLREDETDEIDTEQVLTRVETQLQYSISTLENYLDWAQSQMQGLNPEMEQLNLYDDVAGIIDLMRSESQSKKIELLNKIDESITVTADKGMLFIILKNLISNALKFSHPEGEIIFDAKSKGSRIVLSVKDSGTGISVEDQQKLFRAFDFSRKGTRDEKGTGLGLPICRELTRLQNGKIWFESVPDKGTVFYVELEGAEEVVEV